MRYSLLLLGLIIGILPADGQEVFRQFEQANQLYRDGKYAGSAELFEQILRQGYESPELYFNLGNAYFKSENLPAAILSYERAYRFSPNDEDVRYNLRIVNLRITDKIEPIPKLFFVEWWESFMNLTSSGGWAAAVIASGWLVALCASLFVVLRSEFIRRLLFMCGLVLLFVALTAGLCGYQRYHAEYGTLHAIVFTRSIPVKSAPDAGSVDLFVLHEGVKVELLDTVGNWKKIRLPDGKVGWLTIDNIEII